MGRSRPLHGQEFQLYLLMGRVGKGTEVKKGEPIFLMKERVKKRGISSCVNRCLKAAAGRLLRNSFRNGRGGAWGARTFPGGDLGEHEKEVKRGEGKLEWI